jgi:alpha-beta hydrolase superfamily lysophospholipase
MQKLVVWFGGIIVLLVCVVAAAILWGGPKAIAAMDSINSPFKNLDYSAMPAVQRFTARDGAALAYRHYPVTATTASTAIAATTTASATAAATPSPRRIVLIHGSSASSRSMHPLAQALVAGGFAVDVIDMRGHGDSGTRGQIAYIGQLEDDLADFMRSVPFAGPNTLMGFSAGGGFVLRFSASPQTALFDRYVVLSPFLIQAPSNRPDSGGWASVGLPRIVALTMLNKIGINAWNDLQVTQFALNAEAAKFLTSSYSFALATNFGAHLDYAQDITRAPAALKLVAGVDDELMFSERYAAVFASAGKTVPITLVPGANHIGVILNAAALAAIVAASHS